MLINEAMAAKMITVQNTSPEMVQKALITGHIEGACELWWKMQAKKYSVEFLFVQIMNISDGLVSSKYLQANKCATWGKQIHFAKLL